MSAIQKLALVADDHIDILVNSSVPEGRGKHKNISFDAVCERLKFSELEALRGAVAELKKDAIVDLGRRVLVSFRGLRDYEGTEFDGTDAGVIDSFFETWPLPIDLATAYLEAVTNNKDKKVGAGKLTANGRSAKN
jgi:hypothetical protein